MRIAEAIISGTLVFVATASHAGQGLRHELALNIALRDVKIADELRIHCDDAEARLFTAWQFLGSLREQARDLGYNDEEIEDFVTSKIEKARVADDASEYMKVRGVIPGQEGTYCALARQEVADASQIGKLLKVK